MSEVEVPVGETGGGLSDNILLFCRTLREAGCRLALARFSRHCAQ